MAQLTQLQINEAENLAKEILNTHYDGEDRAEFPLDLNSLLSSNDLSLKEGVFKDDTISGAYNRRDQTVYVAKKDPSTRKLFTIAHEIGHHKLHSKKDQVKTEILFRKQIGEFGHELPIIETQANWFAACLLMPEVSFRKVWRHNRSVSETANFFGVSRSAVKNRIKSLKL